VIVTEIVDRATIRFARQRLRFTAKKYGHIEITAYDTRKRKYTTRTHDPVPDCDISMAVDNLLDNIEVAYKERLFA